MKNTKLGYAKILFRTLKETNDAIDKFNILDYYTLRALQYVKRPNSAGAADFSALLRQFMDECRLNDQIKDLEMFFFALANFIDSNYFYVVNSHNKENSEHIRLFVANLGEIVKNTI
tara:strand:- start:6521 stop:6871 length:351 start_codon:yes stop_codon:yes gene_type:complete